MWRRKPQMAKPNEKGQHTVQDGELMAAGS